MSFGTTNHIFSGLYQDSEPAGAPEEEIEITPEMIEAGERIILGDVLEIGGLFDASELAKRVYLAMADLDLLRPKKRGLPVKSTDDCPSLFESFLLRHPITDEFRAVLAVEITLLRQSFRDRFKHLIDGAHADQFSSRQKTD